MWDRHRLQHAKKKLRAVHRRVRLALVRRFFSFGPEELLRALRSAGVQPGDSIMVHAAFESHHGFRGSVESANDTFLEAVGPRGHLLMVSLPYRSSSLQYLANLKQFDVRRTPSAMGLMSEFFRRRPEVLRSAHPTHPVLACGPQAEWFVEGHEHCAYPCGPGTPFDKLLQVGGKVAFFNVSFAYFTFFHFLEHRVGMNVGFPLYAEEAFEVPVIGRDGERLTVRTHAFAEEAIRRRRPEKLEGWLRGRGLIRTVRIGASALLLVDLREVVGVVDEMAKRREYFYDMGPGRS